VQSGLVDDQRAVYESYASGTQAFGADQTVASDDPRQVADRLAAAVVEVGADALNLRVQLPGMTAEQVREQIEQIGSTVLPLLKKALPTATSAP
jgi:hypothetical protein